MLDVIHSRPLARLCAAACCCVGCVVVLQPEMCAALMSAS